MPRPKQELPESLLTLTAPALPDADIARLSRLLDASPEEFQKALAGLFKRLALEGFRCIQAPRNYKELATVVDLWRKLEGIDAKEKGTLPAGLVGVIRGVTRRPVVVDVEEGELGFE